MSEPNVIVYTMPNCVQCNATYRALDSANISYTVIDVSKDEEARQKIMALGHRAAPVVVVGEEHWSGFRPDLIAKLKQ